VRTLKLTLAYDGSRFVGWQRQAAGESIQALLEEACASLEGGPVTVQGAGRTDAGVHALGQVASVEISAPHDVDTLQRAINAQLPPDIRVREIAEAPPGFQARFSARRKTYRYLVRNAPFASPFERAFVWHVREPLQLPAMQAAAAALCGTHDFAAFRSAGGDVATTTRTILRSSIDMLPVTPGPLEPTGADQRYILGMTLVAEDPAKAKAAFEEYVKLAPTSPNAAIAKQLIAELEKQIK